MTTTTDTRAVTVGEAEHGRLWENGTLIYRESDGREWAVNYISDRANGQYCLHGSYPVSSGIMSWYKPCTFESLTLDYTPHAPATTTDTRLDAEREIVRLSNALAEAERQRDEARAEVERLEAQNRRLAEANVEYRSIVEIDVALLEAFEASPEMSLTTYIYSQCDDGEMLRHLKNARALLNELSSTDV